MGLGHLVGLHFSVRAMKRKNSNAFSKPNFEPGPNPDSGPFTAIASLQQIPIAEKEVSAVKLAEQGFVQALIMAGLGADVG